jgi:hypothetical protein
MAPVGEGDTPASEPVLLTEPVAEEPAAAPHLRASDPAPERGPRGGFLPTLLGGALAAGLGAGAVLYALPDGWRGSAPAVDPTALDAALSELEARVAALRAEHGAQATEIAGLMAMADQVTAAEAALRAADERIAALESALAALTERLDAVEMRPVTGGGAPVAAVEALTRELEALKADVAAAGGGSAAAMAGVEAAAKAAEERIAAAEREAERLRAEAEGAAKAQAARAALSHLEAALATGAPIDAALADLAEAGVAVPEALTSQAGGVPSLAALRTAFPEAARLALAASIQDTAGDGVFDRVTAFLKVQTGARSLAPRDGDDPDAVLSRAEAALGAGDLAGAIGELAALPQSGQDAMAEWRGLAERRLAALAAAATIAGAMP